MTTLTPIPPLADDLEFLSIVSQWDPETPYQQWIPSTLVPATFRPAAPSRVFVVTNNKGGVGKTTTAVELAAAWASMGLRVRLIDGDPQNAAISFWLGVVYPEGLPVAERYNLRHVFLGTDKDPNNPNAPVEDVSLDQATYPTAFKNLYVVPCDDTLTRVEYERSGGTDDALRYAIAESQEQFDVTVIDASRTMSLVTLACLIAADDAIIPIKPGVLDAQGSVSINKVIAKIQRRQNPKLRVAAILTTMWEKSNLAREVEESAAEDYPEAIVSPVRKTVSIAEAPATHSPTRIHAPRATAVADYGQIARLLLDSVSAA
ncbi:ParA family protein [Streptomyces sp. MBT53]|uniref:ParA family protein n=1 Tax=Streptomyces sp. MBT53 TaxID=1488384 RepID=UPI001911CD06|nr:ParA family protein [Streptomyces sp. MBT53]MBK6017721.1 ParA family protein [Streptomyces sp. MBT53]